MVFVIHSDEFKSIGTHCIDLYLNGNNVMYFESFRVGHIPKETKKLKGNKNIITKIYRIQAHHLIRCGYFCIEFIDFMLKKFA